MEWILRKSSSTFGPIWSHLLGNEELNDKHQFFRQKDSVCIWRYFFFLFFFFSFSLPHFFILSLHFVSFLVSLYVSFFFLSLFPCLFFLSFPVTFFYPSFSFDTFLSLFLFLFLSFLHFTFCFVLFFVLFFFVFVFFHLFHFWGILFSRFNLSQNLENFEFWADKFEQLPMYFMTFFGQENVRNVIEVKNNWIYIFF